MRLSERDVLLAYQFAYLALQVEDAVEFPLPAALGGDTVFTPSAHVVDELELLRRQLVHLHHHLEVVAWKICDLIDGERKLDL